MHRSVYEVTHKPIPISQRTRAGNLPDWFYERVCDYAENTTPEQREAAIRALSLSLGPGCDRNGDRLMLSPTVRDTFFRESYHCFRTAAKALSMTDYAVFAGVQPAPAFQAALSGLNDSYEDTRGIYIYSTETELLVTLEYWLRNADLSLPFYIGGVVDYHY